ncbi:MAG TPA: HEAT repeat domain-containing protein [Rugosimonospora sp.]|nr:HEAT repeat domain-containing protein [Rugosimonospora sp.]
MNTEATGGSADLAALAADPSTPTPELASALMRCADPDCADPEALPVALELARHPDPEIRRAAAQVLPALGQLAADDPNSRDAVVSSLIALTRDGDEDVRDWACFALGTQLSDVDSPELRDALAERLDDEHDDTRCEATLGLARRSDPRTLPVLRLRLAAPNVYALEIESAGALGDPSLHTLVRAHLAGWDDEVVPKVCAALRLTDPDGVGDDLLDGLADWYRAGSLPGAPPDGYWWGIAEGLLELAPRRAVEIADAVRQRLARSGGGLDRLLSSPLADVARDHGWTG